VRPPTYDRDPATRSAVAIIAVDEGPRYFFGEPEFEGNEVFSKDRLTSAVPVEPGMPFEPQVPDLAIARLEELYWAAGYNNVAIELAERRDYSAGVVNLHFQIAENRQDVVESLDIQGNDEVSNSFIRERVPFMQGDVFDAERAAKIRTDLYKTGAFTFIDLQPEPTPEGVQGILPASQRPLKLLMTVQEVRPYRIRYGGFFDTERGPGALLEFENRNTLGSARFVGIRTRYDSELREARTYFGQPLNWGGPSTINVTGFRRREITSREDAIDFVTDRTGFSLQQEFELWGNWLFNYGYRFERTRSFDREPDPNCPLPLDNPFCRFDESFDVAPLTSSLSLDRRDNPLDARRGLFTSHSVEFATASLASDLRFVRYFGQFFRYVALSKPPAIRGEKGPTRPRFVYAGGVRLGLARGFGGQRLVFSERFLAGGGTTIRGFEQDKVGPLDFRGDPNGGEAVFILNNEVRFPLISIFEGVGFVDVGNVYDRVANFNPFTLRKAAGLGLRVRTPFFLLRLDYGHKLDRRTDESAGEVFFSIGQAF
jgi:outer membrane protein assembly complex protein YaeT